MIIQSFFPLEDKILTVYIPVMQVRQVATSRRLKRLIKIPGMPRFAVLRRYVIRGSRRAKSRQMASVPSIEQSSLITSSKSV